MTCNFASCAWDAVSDQPSWLTVTSGASGMGSGSVGYTVADNPGGPRSGTLTIAGQAFAVIARGNTLVLVPAVDVRTLRGVARGADTSGYRDP